MKLTSIIYRSLIGFYELLPFKATICKGIKASGLPNDKFYKDLRFTGPFTLQTMSGESFKMISHKASLENELFWKGISDGWENDTLWLWYKLSRHSKVIVDVGANVGIYCLSAKAINPDATVFAFEPAKRTYQDLLENIAVNNLAIVTEPLALSDHPGKAVFYDTVEAHQTSASLNPKKLKELSWNTAQILEYEVEITTLDNYLEKKGINGIDLIKIDVEMHEPEVLAGMQKLIANSRPSIIVEVLNDSIGEQVASLLKGHGYLSFHMADKEKLKPTEDIRMVPHQWNYFFCQPKVADLLKEYILA